MAVVTSLGNSFTTANGTKTVTATPALDDLIVIVTAHSGNLTQTGVSDDAGGTYVNIASASKLLSADGLGVFVRSSLIGSAVSTVFTTAPGSTTGGGMAVLKVTGMTRTGSSAVRGFGVESNIAALATPAPILSSVPLTGNPVIGAVLNCQNVASLVPRTSYTERYDNGYSTPTNGLQVMSIDSGETSDTITWGSASGSEFCSLVIELDTSATVSGALHKLYGPFGGLFHKLI